MHAMMRFMIHMVCVIMTMRQHMNSRPRLTQKWKQRPEFYHTHVNFPTLTESFTTADSPACTGYHTDRICEM